MEERGNFPNRELVDKIEKKEVIKKIFILSVVVILIIIIIYSGFLIYNSYKKQSIKTGDNIEKLVLGDAKDQFYAKIKNFPLNCSGIKFIINTDNDKKSFCYMNSTPAEIQFIAPESTTETFDYKVPASCFGLNDFSTVSEIDAVYLTSNNFNLTTNNTVPAVNKINVTRIFTNSEGSGGGGDDDDDDCNLSCSGKTCGSNGCDGSCGSCSVWYNCVSGACLLSDNPYIIKNNFDNLIYDNASLQRGVNSSGIGNFTGFNGLIDGASASYYVENYSSARTYIVVGKFNHTITYEEFKKNYLDFYLNESLEDIDTNLIKVSDINEFPFESNRTGYFLILSKYTDQGYLRIIWASGNKVIYLAFEPLDTFETYVNEDIFLNMLDAYEEKHIADLIFPTNCSESDNGKDYSNSGSTQVYLEGYEWPLDSTGDYCQYNSQILNEKYCENKTIQEEIYECPVWCFEGGCVNENMYLRCEDNEIITNYSVKGNVSLIINRTGEIYSVGEDYCVGGGPFEEITIPMIYRYLIEYYCDNDSIPGGWYDCSQEGKICLDGACINMICIDSDNGIISNLYGEVYLKAGEEEIMTNNDSCINVGYAILVAKNSSGEYWEQIQNCTNPVIQSNASVGDCSIASYDYVNSCVGQDCYVHEKYCKDLGNGAYDGDANEKIFCPNGCLDGACVDIPCTDSDNGINYSVFGGISQEGQIIFSETVRGVDEIIVYDNTNAYIIPLDLNVTLGGEYSTYLGVFNVTEVNFYSEGDVQNNIVIGYTILNDHCLDSNFVIEYFCDNPPSYYDNYYCPNGCSNGVCSEGLLTLSFWDKFIQWIKNLF